MRYFLFVIILTPVFSTAAVKRETVCVKSDGANLRAEPNNDSEVSWRVNKYMPLIKIDEKEGWWKVEDLEGKTHWISKKLVTKEMKCLVIKTDTAYLRKGPGKEFVRDDDLKVDKYTPFKQIKQERGWSQLEGGLPEKLWVYKASVWP